MLLPSTEFFRSLLEDRVNWAKLIGPTIVCQIRLVQRFLC